MFSVSVWRSWSVFNPSKINNPSKLSVDDAERLCELIDLDIVKFIREVPKTELHLHIEGTLEPELMFDLAKRNNIKIPYSNVDEVKSAYNFSNLETFLNIYYEGSKVLINEQDFFDLTWSYAVKCREDNIVHTEIFFDPQAHLSRGVKFETIINGINNALLKANKEFGLTYKIIMCFLRHLDEKSAFKVLDQAIEHKDKIIAVGLDSSEKGNPPSKFKNVFNDLELIDVMKDKSD